MGGGRGCLVQETVHEAEARDTAAVRKGLQLVGDGGRGANQPGGLGLDVVQELEGSGGGTHPDRAAVLHPRPYGTCRLWRERMGGGRAGLGGEVQWRGLRSWRPKTHAGTRIEWV